MWAVRSQVFEQVGSERTTGGGVCWMTGWAGEWMYVATRGVSRKATWAVDYNCDG